MDIDYNDIAKDNGEEIVRSIYDRHRKIDESSEVKSTDRYPTFSDVLANPTAHMPIKKK